MLRLQSGPADLGSSPPVTALAYYCPRCSLFLHFHGSPLNSMYPRLVPRIGRASASIWRFSGVMVAIGALGVSSDSAVEIFFAGY